MVNLNLSPTKQPAGASTPAGQGPRASTLKTNPIIHRRPKQIIIDRIIDKIDNYRGRPGLGYIGNCRKLTIGDLQKIEHRIDAAISEKEAGNLDLANALFRGWSWWDGYYEALYGPHKGAQIAASLGILIDEEA